MLQEVTPDKGLFGPGYTLTYNIPDFKQKLLEHWNKDHAISKDYSHKEFSLFRSCLQVIAVTKWDNCFMKYSDGTKNNKGLRSCIRDYLESIAKCTNLGNQMIHWLRLQNKPAHMPFEEFLNRHTQIWG
jgi:hypothetical protein